MIVGITGVAGSGKTTAAQVLVNQGWIKYSFADELKRIAKDEFGWDGLKDEKGRRLLQVLGTEAGRAYNENLWVERMQYRLSQAKVAGKNIVIDDVRFNNEAQLIQDMGGFVIELSGHGYYNGFWDKVKALFKKGLSSHESEKGVSLDLIDFYWKFKPMGSQTLFAMAFDKVFKQKFPEMVQLRWEFYE